MKLFSLILTVLFAMQACKKTPDDITPIDNTVQVKTDFASINEFTKTLSEYALNEDVEQRDSVLKVLFDTLKTEQKIPFAMDDSVVFLYYGKSATSVSWAGDFNGWDNSSADWKGAQIGTSGVWMLKKKFPTDARLDYKVVTNGSNWILDPLNSRVQYSGFGPNSELRMPAWVYPPETILGEGVNRGTLSDNILIMSTNMAYQIQYRVYLPFNYENLQNLPVVYVADGHEYADDKLGSVKIVADNLTHTGKIEPVIFVFIDPRNPSNLGENRRATEFRSNPNYVKFVSEELVPQIDATYKTANSANRRCIMGTSYGGWNASYFGVMRSDIFGLLCIHSPAFDSTIPAAYNAAAKLPLKIYMSTGVINDTQDKALALKAVLDSKGYDYQYKEVNEGHSWGNWRALIDEPLIYFFGTK